MRHRNAGPKLNRSSSHRASMGANLATALLTHGRIQTTAPRAIPATVPSGSAPISTL